jgi:hypothetical protein
VWGEAAKSSQSELEMRRFNYRKRRPYMIYFFQLYTREHRMCMEFIVALSRNEQAWNTELQHKLLNKHSKKITNEINHYLYALIDCNISKCRDVSRLSKMLTTWVIPLECVEDRRGQ